MKKVHSVHWEFGWLTGIVVVSYDEGEFRFRCFGNEGCGQPNRSSLGRALTWQSTRTSYWPAFAGLLSAVLFHVCRYVEIAAIDAESL